MSVQLSANHQNTYYSTDYSLAVNHHKNKSLIFMQMHNGIHSTASLPNTFTILNELLPSIFKSECFNDIGQPFSIEVQHTEIAHLFEHILLEYLCSLKLKHGERHAIVNGVTTWNWYVNPSGSFEISIDTGVKDSALFSVALRKTIVLFETILERHILSIN